MYLLWMKWAHCHFKLYHNFCLFKSLSFDSMINHRLTSKLQWFWCRATNFLYPVSYSVLKARAGSWISTSGCCLLQGEGSLCKSSATFVILHSPSWKISGFWCHQCASSFSQAKPDFCSSWEKMKRLNEKLSTWHCLGIRLRKTWWYSYNDL